ncbi:hypothetical protein [Paenibacillus sp. FSL L8-0696]|uniref:hypothetical protein n=1 Tax=unclassified Paenibacillus TaxID=185978 RepID=UPI003119AF8E
MNTTQRLITFSKLSGECFIKEGKINDPVYVAAPEKNNLSHLKSKEELVRLYSNKRLEKYREIMESFSINFESLKIDEEVYVPASQKENVNWIIEQYTTPVFKSFRNISNNFPKSSLEDKEPKNAVKIHDIVTSLKQPHLKNPLREIIENSFEKLSPTEISKAVVAINSILNDQLEGDSLAKELNKVQQRSGILLREALNQFHKDTLPLLIEEIKSTAFITDNETILNDIDRLTLMQYYMEILQQTRDRFRKITEISAELRTEELANISIKQANNFDENTSGALWFQLSDFNSVIEEAIQIYKEEIE